MPVQTTFTLIPERPVNPTAEPIRPMTSKQIKKAHKAADKQPRMSRAEQRKMELAEQERIRKEFEKERMASRARAARDRKKAKEEAAKEERRKSGRPLVDVRPSQDTISRFLFSNTKGRKRDSGGEEVDNAMASIQEEASDRDSVPPEHQSDAEKSPEIPDLGDVGSAANADTALPGPASDPASPPVEHHTDKQEGNKLPGSRGSPGPGSNHEYSRVNQERASKRPRIDYGFDDDNMTNPFLSTEAQGPAAKAANETQQGREPHATAQSTKNQKSPTTGGSTRRQEWRHPDHDPELGNGPNYDWDAFADDDEFLDRDLEDFSPAGRWSPPGSHQTSNNSHSASCTRLPSSDHQSLPARRKPSTPTKQPSSFIDGSLDDDTLCQLETPKMAAEPKTKQPDTQRPSIPTRVVSQPFLDDDDDDDGDDEDMPPPHQLPPPQSETPKMAAEPKTRQPDTQRPSIPTRVVSQPFLDDDDDDEDMPPPRQQLPPPSTQAVLLNIDDYFPSPSQQERELEGDPAPQITQPSPCLQRGPPPPPQKRFFTSSGSNQLLSLAVQRSKRTAALENIQRQERQRREAQAAATPVRRPLAAQNKQPTNMAPPPAKSASRTPSTAKPRDPPVKPAATPFKSVTMMPPKPPECDKENDPSLAGPPASQESEYGGLWIDEMAGDLAIDQLTGHR